MTDFSTERYEGALPPRLESRVRSFLTAQGLRYEPGDFTVVVRDAEGNVAATGSLAGKVLKCIAVDERLRGEGLTAPVMTALRARAFEKGLRRLFLFTKPKNGSMFRDFGFYPVSHTSDMLLMENTRSGISDFAASLDRGPQGGVHGAVVANCNPFTLGHRYLAERAAASCDTLHLFILSEDQSAVPADVRFSLARQGVSDLKNVLVHPTSDYLISSVTFPTYFLKDEQKAGEAAGRLDLTVFCDYFVPALSLTRRFVGQEPFCPVTAAYNRLMHEMLPPRGVEVVEIPRLEKGGCAVSASRVRQLWKEKKWDELRPLVPDGTYRYLSEGVCSPSDA